jgi:hypothetical protein
MASDDLKILGMFMLLGRLSQNYVEQCSQVWEVAMHFPLQLPNGDPISKCKKIAHNAMNTRPNGENR